MSELHVSASEDMDLRIRWLGPNSDIHVKTIKPSLGYNPSQGVKKNMGANGRAVLWPGNGGGIHQIQNSFPRLENKENKKKVI